MSPHDDDNDAYASLHPFPLKTPFLFDPSFLLVPCFKSLFGMILKTARFSTPFLSVHLLCSSLSVMVLFSIYLPIEIVLFAIFPYIQAIRRRLNVHRFDP